MSLALLLGAQLDAVVAAGGEAIGISAPGRFVADDRAARGAARPAHRVDTRLEPMVRSPRRRASCGGSFGASARPCCTRTTRSPGCTGGSSVASPACRSSSTPSTACTPRRTIPRPVARSCTRWRRSPRAGPTSSWSRTSRTSSSCGGGTSSPHASCATSATASTSNGSAPHRSAPPSAPSSARSWGVDDETVVVGTVGRLVAEKGYHELFRAVADLGPGIRLVVVGGPDAERPDALDASVLQRPRPPGSVLLGHRDDVDRLLGGFDLFVLASAPRGPATGGDGSRRVRSADRGHRRPRLPAGGRRRDDRTARPRGRRRCAANGDQRAGGISASGGRRWARRHGPRLSVSSTSATSCGG